MSKIKWMFPAVLLVMSCNSLWAQTPKPEGPPSIGKELDGGIKSLEREFVSAAEAMPEDKYGYTPTVGEFKGVRSFTQQVKHVAAVNYMIASGILAEKPPVEIGGENGPDSMKAKADIVKFLKDSFAYTHKAVLSIDEKNFLQPTKSPFGDGMVTRLSMATWIGGHSFDHYGQMVEYLRMNNIVPPASRQQ